RTAGGPRQGGMRALQFARPGDRLSVLCLGAHSDDIEIGTGATLLSMMDRGVHLEVHWCVLSGGVSERESEAKASAADFLSKAASMQIEVMPFKDGFFPEQGDTIKSWFEMLKARTNPDLISRITATTHTRTIAKSADLLGIHSGIIAFLNTRSRSGTETWVNQISMCRFLLKCYDARSNCWTCILGLSVPSSGSILKFFSDWLV